MILCLFIKDLCIKKENKNTEWNLIFGGEYMHNFDGRSKYFNTKFCSACYTDGANFIARYIYKFSIFFIHKKKMLKVNQRKVKVNKNDFIFQMQNLSKLYFESVGKKIKRTKDSKTILSKFSGNKIVLI